MTCLPTHTQQTGDKRETRSPHSDAGCYRRMLGALFNNTGESSRLPPQSLLLLAWMILKHSRVADLPGIP